MFWLWSENQTYFYHSTLNFLSQICNIFAGDALVMSYIPDPATQTKTIPRKFAYRVACALRPGYMNDIIT